MYTYSDSNEGLCNLDKDSGINSGADKFGAIYTWNDDSEPGTDNA